MKITRRDIANYKLLRVLLEKDKRKLDRYIEKRPSGFSGKVYGSNQSFPYQARGFTVGGCTDSEMRQVKEWEARCREMEVKVQEDIQDKAILEYTKDGLSQQEIAFKMRIDQSVVSRRLKKYVSD